MVFRRQRSVTGLQRWEGRRHTGIAAVALIALVACLAPAVDAYGTTHDRTLYDQSSIDSRINAEVDRIQALYASQGQAAFDTITSAGLADANTAILYVVNADTL